MKNGMVRRLLFNLHLYAGLTLGLLVTLSGLTGSLLVFRHEIDAALSPNLLRVRPEGRQVPLQSVVDTVNAAYPNQKIQNVFLPRDPGEVHEVWLKGDILRVYVNPYTAQIIGERNPKRTAMGWLFALHTELLSGERSEKVLLLSALLLVVLSVSGIVLWWPAAGKYLEAHVTIKWRASGKRVTYDLHRALGFWAAALLCLTAITGASFIPPFEEWFASAASRITNSPLRAQKPRVARTPDAAPLSLDTIVSRANAALPGGRLTRIVLPSGASAPYVLRKRFPGEMHPNGMTYIYVDPYSGHVLRADDSRLPTASLRIMNLRYPLHTGVWLGLPTRFLQFLLGLTPLAMYISGCLMWWNRTRGKKRRVVRTQPEPLVASR